MPTQTPELRRLSQLDTDTIRADVALSMANLHAAKTAQGQAEVLREVATYVFTHIVRMGVKCELLMELEPLPEAQRPREGIAKTSARGRLVDPVRLGPGEFRELLPGEDVTFEHDSSRAAKQSAGKGKLARIPYEALVLEADVFEFGAVKYSWGGYMSQPMTYLECVDALVRHAFQFAQGHDLDLGPNGEHGPTDDPKTNMKWSGLSHVGHMRCCTSMLAWIMAHRPDRDDRLTVAPASLTTDWTRGKPAPEVTS